MPFDEGPRDGQFLEFRTNMIAATKKRRGSWHVVTFIAGD